MCVCVQVYILKKDEGGRHTPFVNNYSPQLYTRTASVNTSMILPEGQSIFLSHVYLFFSQNNCMLKAILCEKLSQMWAAGTLVSEKYMNL